MGDILQTVYLVRHGESTENVRSSPAFEQGMAALTETGRAQAKAIAGRASRIHFDAIISSPMVRAHDTALEIARVTEKRVELSELFVERTTPTSFVGRPWSDDSFRADFKRWERTLYGEGESVEDGETFASIRDRGVRALSYLAERPERSLLVVSHGFFLRILVGLTVLQDDFLPQDLERMYRTMITRNTGITVLVRKAEAPNSWALLTWNDHAHLG